MNSNEKSECLRDIFRQIISNCEDKHSKNENNSDKYADLLEFVSPLSWFQHELRYWYPDQYECIKNDFKTEYSDLEFFVVRKTIRIDFDMLCDIILKSGQANREIFWKTFLKEIKKNVKRVELNFKSGLYMEEFIKIICAFQDESSLMAWSVDMDGIPFSTFDNTFTFKVIHLHVKISAAVLVKLLKFHNEGHKLPIFEIPKFLSLANTLLNKNAQ